MPNNNTRLYWINTMKRIAQPVLINLSKGKLKETMPVRGKVDRSDCTYLEALGRLLSGMAPWLESSPQSAEEERDRIYFADLARKGIAAAVNPDSPDFMNFSKGSQPLVDAAFLAQAIIRAPKELWQKLDDSTKSKLIDLLKSTRQIKPYFCNWLLFSGMIEAAFFSLGEQYDPMRVDYAIKQHEQWYKGDGTYGDGPEFHWDYYNSFVIHPMLIDIIRICDQYEDWQKLRPAIIGRAKRYAVILERLISPEGTFPPIGRSLTYRMGVFHLLSQLAYLEELPKELSPAQVRCALTAVIKKIMEMPGTFDANGWLHIGLCGHQPNMGEEYISTGSLYLCSTVFLPLGLRQDKEFWSLPDEDWTSKKIWSGLDMPADSHYEE